MKAAGGNNSGTNSLLISKTKSWVLLAFVDLHIDILLYVPMRMFTLDYI